MYIRKIHLGEDVFSYTNRVAGRFEKVGPPRELYCDPHTPFEARFVGENNAWPCAIYFSEKED